MSVPITSVEEGCLVCLLSPDARGRDGVKRLLKWFVLLVSSLGRDS